MKPTFFREDLNAQAEEFRGFLPVNVNFDFGTIAPALYDAEEKYMKRIVGADLWNELADYYCNDEHEADAVKDGLIARLQSAVLRIAYYESFDLLVVNLTDSGIQNPNGDATAYRYQADAAKETLGRQAFEHLQYFYDALAESGLRVWEADDPWCPMRRGSLFDTPHVFFATTEMEEDFRLMAKLRPAVTMTERISLPYRIGSVLATELLSRPSTGRMADSMVLQLARRFVAYKVLADQVMLLHAYIDESGATVRSIKAEGAAGGTAVQTADLRTRQHLKQQYGEQAEAAATQLVMYLKQCKDVYPEIEAVVSSDKPQVHLHRNNGKHTFRV